MNGFQQKCSRPLVLFHHGSPCLYQRSEGILVPRKEESDSSRRQSIVYIHPRSFSMKGRKKINRQEIYYIYVIRNHLMSNHSQLGMRSLLLIPLRSQNLLERSGLRSPQKKSLLHRASYISVLLEFTFRKYLIPLHFLTQRCSFISSDETLTSYAD